jgi:plastocyanin
MRYGTDRRSAPLLLVAGLALVATACGGGEADQGPAPKSVVLRAGVNDPQDRNIAILEFLPESIAVKTGATVVFGFAGGEPHTVTFVPAGQQPPAPDAPGVLEPKPATGPYDGATLVSSGLLPQGPNPGATFNMSFAKAGTYNYVCIIHPLMTGTVKAVDADKDADSQSEMTKRGDTEAAKWQAEGRAAKKKLLETPARTVKNPDGTTTHYVEMGTTTEHTDVLAFQPLQTAIKAKDKVVFVNNAGSPHTATFAGTKQLPQNPESPEAKTAAPGKSPQTLNATDLFNTGRLPPNAPPGGGPPEAARSFMFDVPTAGTYAYVCLPHALSGMTGTIQAT